MSRRANGEGSLYQRASDGKWVGSLTLETGRRRAVYGDTQQQARDKLRQVLRAVEDGLPVSADRLTVGAYLDSWLAETLPAKVKAGRMAASTLDSYRDNVRLHVMPHIGRQRLAGLKPATLRRWLTELQDKQQAPRCARCARLRERGERCDRHHDTVMPLLSARTVGYCHAILRAALSDAVMDELVARNVATLVEPPVARRAPVTPLTLVEATRLHAASAEDRLRVLWLVILGLGLRRGEALALRWDDVDLDAGTVTVTKSLQRRRGEPDEVTGRRRGELVEVDPKTAASAATLALPDFLAEELRAHRLAQRGERLAALVWVDPGLVFATQIGTPLEPRNVNRAWWALCDRAGVRRLRLHDLRHSAASFALAAGVGMKAIQAMLRHTRLATTADLYTHVLETVQRSAAEHMDGVLREITG